MALSLSILTTLTLFAVTYQQTLKISCTALQECQKNGYIYSLIQANQTKQVCTQESICPFQEIEIQVFQCQTSISGRSCNSGICYYVRDNTDCVDEYFKDCTIPSRTKMECGNCNQNSCASQKCISYDGGEHCSLGDSCGVDQFYIEKQLCQGKKNYLGQTCFCCGRFLISGNSGKCLDGTPFESQILKEWTVGFENTFEIDLRFCKICLLGLILMTVL